MFSPPNQKHVPPPLMAVTHSHQHFCSFPPVDSGNAQNIRLFIVAILFSSNFSFFFPFTLDRFILSVVKHSLTNCTAKFFLEQLILCILDNFSSVITGGSPCGCCAAGLRASLPLLLFILCLGFTLEKSM